MLRSSHKKIVQKVGPSLTKPTVAGLLSTSGPGFAGSGLSRKAVVREVACTGGLSVVDRIVAPAIVYNATEVRITLAAQTLPGIHTCTLNPTEPFEVQLAEPLGNRTLAGLSDLADD